jgi:hypothetical protein
MRLRQRGRVDRGAARQACRLLREALAHSVADRAGDQAEAIFVLVSQRLAKTTGHVIPVDGGLQDGFMR